MASIPDELLERAARVGRIGGVTYYKLALAPDRLAARCAALPDPLEGWCCGQCGSAAHARSIRDPERCVRCVAARAAA